MTSRWRHVILASKSCWESLCWSIQKKKMKKNSLNLPNTLKNMEKCKNFITSLIFMRWCHSHMTANFGYTSSQLRYKPKLRSIDHVLLLLLPFEKIAPLTRCHVTHDDVTKMATIEDRRLYGLHVYTKFHKNWNLFNGKSDHQKNPVQNLWDFFR